MSPLRAAGLALLLVGPAAPGRAAVEIEPGDRVFTAAGYCTLGFVFDGTGAQAGRVYLGTGAGCVRSVGDDARLSSGELFGDVAYVGERGVAARDFALIQVRAAYIPAVSLAASVGVATAAETRTGDRIRIGRDREGVLVEDDSGAHRTYGPIGPGDAGAPLVHVPTGKALGTVSRPGYCAEPCPVPDGPAACPVADCPPAWEGPTAQGIVARAAAAGFTVRLR